MAPRQAADCRRAGVIGGGMGFINSASINVTLGFGHAVTRDLGTSSFSGSHGGSFSQCGESQDYMDAAGPAPVS